MDTRTKFQRRLTELGDEKAAELLGVSQRAAQAYRLGDRLPRPRQAIEVARVLGLKLTDIYHGEAA